MTSSQSHSNGAKPRSPGSRNGHRLVPLEPAFEDAKHHIQIFQGDCLQILPAMPEECVDVIFADPPYFLSNGGITCHAGRMVSVNKGAWDKSKGAEENHEFNRAWLAACQRVLKPNGTIWVSGTAHVIHSVGFAMQQLGFKLLNDISWVKPNPPPNLSCRYFTHATETIIWAAKNLKSRHTFDYQSMKAINHGKQMKSVWEIKPPETWEKKFGKHPAQKPIALLERILLASSAKGDLVLDPFMGGGTTLIAALRLGRLAISFELENSSIDLSLARVVAELVVVQIGTVILSNDLDLDVHFVDRSSNTKFVSMALQSSTRIVHTELNFHFVGAIRREVIFSIAANSMDDAWTRFRASPRGNLEILFVIKTQTEIYLMT